MSLRKSNMTPDPRPDLAAMPVPLPVGFIGQLVFPDIKRGGRTGTLFYQEYAAFQNAITNRSSGGSVSRTALTAARTTWSCGEILTPVIVDAQEITEMGGDEQAEKVLALRGIRGQQKALEVARIAAITAVGYTDISSSDDTICDGIGAAVAAMAPKVMGNTGTLALLGSSTALNVLRKSARVKDSMKNIGASAGNDVRQIGLSALAEYFGVNAVHEGIDGFWPAYGVTLAYLPDPNEDPTVSAQTGRMIKYQFDGQAGDVSCELGYDPALRSPYLDFVSYVDVLTLNDAFIVPLRIVAAPVTTTTT